LIGLEFPEIRSLGLYGFYNLLFLDYQRFHLRLNLTKVHTQNIHPIRVLHISLQLQNRDSIANIFFDNNHQRNIPNQFFYQSKLPLFADGDSLISKASSTITGNDIPHASDKNGDIIKWHYICFF